MKKAYLMLFVVILAFNVQAQNKNTLMARQPLKVNGKLVSDNGAYFLLMQPDGNLCIYDNDERIYWCAMSQNSIGGGELKLGRLGNLVVKNKENGVEWLSNTRPYYDTLIKKGKDKPVKLVLENNGVLSLYNKKDIQVWSVNVGAHNKSTLPTNQSLKVNNVNQNKSTITANQPLKINKGFIKKNNTSGDTIIVKIQNHRNDKMLNDMSKAQHLDSVFPIYENDSKTLFNGYAILLQEYAFFTSKVDPAIMGSVKNGNRTGLWTKHQFSMDRNGIYTYGPKIGEENYINDGLEIMWYDSTRKKSEGNNVNGKKDGLWTYWALYSGGANPGLHYLQYEKNYVNGKIQSEIGYSGKGNKNLEGHYLKGKKDGKWIEWFNNIISSETDYDNGKIVLYKYNRLNGTIWWEVSYLNGLRVSKKTFDESGKLTKIENFD